MCITGNAALFAIDATDASVSNLVGRQAEIGELTEEGSIVEDTSLASTAMTKCKGDLVDYGDLTIQVVLDATGVDSWDTVEVYNGLKSDGTYADGTLTNQRGDTHVGPGFISSRVMGAHQNNERVLMSFVWTFTDAVGFAKAGAQTFSELTSEPVVIAGHTLTAEDLEFAASSQWSIERTLGMRAGKPVRMPLYSVFFDGEHVAYAQRSEGGAIMFFKDLWLMTEAEEDELKRLLAAADSKRIGKKEGRELSFEDFMTRKLYFREPRDE